MSNSIKNNSTVIYNNEKYIVWSIKNNIVVIYNYKLGYTQVKMNELNLIK